MPSQPPSASHPPSTRTLDPVRKDASSEARKATTRATSRGSARRPIGVRRATSSSVKPPALLVPASSSVSTYAGATLITRTPRRAHSTPSVLVSPSSPCLAAV
jgi:hypothetical protein